MHNKMPEYVHCRVDPFTSTGKGSIPDASNFGFVTSDTRVVDTITIPGSATTQSFSITTMPMLPAAAILSTKSAITGFTVNGVAITDPGYPTTLGPNSNSAAYPLSFIAPFVSVTPPGVAPGSNTAITGSANAVSGRLVSVGYKLIYTGPANSCSGSITVTPNDVSITETSDVFTVTNPVSLRDPAGLAVAVPQNTALLAINTGSDPRTMTRDSVTLRPEQGVYIIPKHKTKDFKNRPFYDTAKAAVANAGNVGTSLINIYSRTDIIANAAYSGGVIWYDSDWTSVQVSVQGTNSDASYRWETIWCMEFNPAPSTIAANFTKKQSDSNPKQIEVAQVITDNQPVAAPLSDPRRR